MFLIKKIKWKKNIYVVIVFKHCIYVEKEKKKKGCMSRKKKKKKKKKNYINFKKLIKNFFFILNYARIWF
jgi:hypothetical protein